MVVALALDIMPQMVLIVPLDRNIRVNGFVLPVHRVLPPDLRVKRVLHSKKGKDAMDSTLNSPMQQSPNSGDIPIHPIVSDGRSNGVSQGVIF